MISNLKEHYKELREQLDDILVEYSIPKEYWHNMTWLNANIENFMKRHPDQFNWDSTKDFRDAIKLIHKLSPTPLNRLHSINYDE